MSIQQQIEKDVEDLTPKEVKEVREFLEATYPHVNNWTIEEIATQARYWREAKQH